VIAVRARIGAGNWGDSASPEAPQELAESLSVGPVKFVPFRPGKFLSDRDRQP
jgi:hypothetical protein